MPAARYAFCLLEKAAEQLVRFSSEDQDLVLGYCRWLAQHPHAAGNGWHRDEAGRAVQARAERHDADGRAAIR